MEFKKAFDNDVKAGSHTKEAHLLHKMIKGKPTLNYVNSDGNAEGTFYSTQDFISSSLFNKEVIRVITDKDFDSDDETKWPDDWHSLSPRTELQAIRR